MKRIRFFNKMSLGIFCIALLLGSMVYADAKKTITLKGSTTVLPIAQATAEIFMDRNPNVDISVQGGGSGVGIAALIDSTTDIATSSRKMKDEEIANAKAKGVNPNEIKIAMDGIAVIVNPKSHIKALTKDQIKAIYTGKISNWADLGGKSMKIVVVNRDSSSGTFETFDQLALDKAKVRPDALTNASNQAVVQTVAQTPGAIGYAGLGYLSPKVKAVTVNGMVCSEDTVLTGKYPLSRPLFMYTNGEPSGAVKAFIDFVLSKEGQKLVKEEGFVALTK